MKRKYTKEFVHNERGYYITKRLTPHRARFLRGAILREDKDIFDPYLCKPRFPAKGKFRLMLDSGNLWLIKDRGCDMDDCSYFM